MSRNGFVLWKCNLLFADPSTLPYSYQHMTYENCAVMEIKPINCKLANHKWWKYLHGMLGGLLDCDDIDIVISSV